jgi:hypothetical protein
MVGVMDLFKITLIIMMFYSFGITIIAYSIPAAALPYVTGFSELNNDIDMENIASNVQGSLQSQTNIPVIELGALVFYSGNILIDLLLNFVFAIPEMFTALINGLLMVFNIPPFIATQIQILTGVMFTVIYFIGVIQLLTGIRSGRLVA